MTLSIAFDSDVTDIVSSCCASRARKADTHEVHADAYVVVVSAHAVIVTVAQQQQKHEAAAAAVR